VRIAPEEGVQSHCEQSRSVWYAFLATARRNALIKTIVFALAAACLVASPVQASSPPPAPHATYYVTNGRKTVAGPFRSYYDCSKRLATLTKPLNDSLFCASTWIR
jgi:hypothetical protein